MNLLEVKWFQKYLKTKIALNENAICTKTVMLHLRPIALSKKIVSDSAVRDYF